MGNLDSGLTTIVSNANTAKNNIRLVPTNAASDAKLNIQYRSQINTTYSASKGQFGSIFNDILGSSNNGGIIGGLHSAMTTIHTTLSGIKTNSGGFSSNSITFDAAIGSINSNLGGFKNTVSNLDTSVGSALSILEAPRDMGSLVVQLFYGVALGVAVLALLGVVLMTFCDKYKCRYLMYFSCLILFFFALIGFLIAIILSILVPLIYWSCDWLSVSIGSAAGFNANFAGVLSDASSRSYISTCLTGGTGDLMAVVAPSSINDINNLKNALLNTNLFNSTTEVNTLNTAIANVTLTINNFKNGLTPDVTDADALASLIQVSRGSNFDAACTSITADGWLMSNANTSFTSCNVAGGGTKDHTTCTSKADLQNNAGAGGCNGCLDSSLILNNFYSADIQGALLTSLNIKYTALCSLNFKTYLGNIWDNYYFYKVPKMVAIGGAGGSGVTGGRWGTAKTSVDTVVTGFTTVNTTMTNVITALNNAVSGIVDPKFGMIAGLNCLIIGEDLSLMVSSICVSNFNTLYITRLLMGISSFGILFALCCIVCSGVRHYKHSERKDKISPNFMGGDKNSFEHTDAAFNRP